MLKQKPYNKNLFLIVYFLILMFFTAHYADTSIFDQMKYLGYLVVYLMLPGWFLFALISPKIEDGITQFCMSWIFGLIIEQFVYLIASFTDLSVTYYGAFIIGLLCAAIVYKKERLFIPFKSLSIEHYSYLTLALIIIYSTTYYNLKYVPLPSTDSDVTYYQDLIWHLSIVSEAKWNGFPFQDPHVAGNLLNYYFFSHIHMASIARITGIESAVVLLRIYPFEMYYFWTLLLCLAGKKILGSWKSGILISIMVILSGSMSGLFQLMRVTVMNIIRPNYPYELVLSQRDIFQNIMFWAPFNSPTFLIGAVFYTTIIIMVCGIKNNNNKLNFTNVSYFALPLIVSAFVKSILLPLVLLGLGCLIFWEFMIKRKFSSLHIVLLSIAVFVYISSRWFTESIYVNFVNFNPFHPILSSDFYEVFVHAVYQYMPEFSLIAKIIAIPIGAFGFAPVQFFGLILFLIFYFKKMNNNDVWLLYTFILPYTIGLLFTFSGGGWNLLLFSLIPLSILSSKGILYLFEGQFSFEKNKYSKILVCLFFSIGVTTMFVKSIFPTTNNNYYINRYGEKPLLTGKLLEALTWLRNNSDKDAVIAVNYTQPLVNKDLWYFSKFSEEEKYWYYPAFSERRFFLAGTFNTPEYSNWAKNKNKDLEELPFSNRRKLLEEFLKNRNINALKEIKEKFGVSYLLIDKRRNLNSWLNERDDLNLKLIFTNQNANIYKLNLL